MPPEDALQTLKTPAGTLLMLLALLSAPVYFFVSAGQSSGFFLLLHTAILVSLARKREYAAGFFVAAGMLKPHLFLALLPLFVLRKQWRVLAWKCVRLRASGKAISAKIGGTSCSF